MGRNLTINDNIYKVKCFHLKVPLNIREVILLVHDHPSLRFREGSLNLLLTGLWTVFSTHIHKRLNGTNLTSVNLILSTFPFFFSRNISSCTDDGAPTGITILPLSAS